MRRKLKQSFVPFLQTAAKIFCRKIFQKKCGLYFNKPRVPFKVTIICARLNAYALLVLYAIYLKKSTTFGKKNKNGLGVCGKARYFCFKF